MTLDIYFLVTIQLCLSHVLNSILQLNSCLYEFNSYVYTFSKHVSPYLLCWSLIIKTFREMAQVTYLNANKTFVVLTMIINTN